LIISLGLATNATRKVTEFELGLLKIDENTFFDAVLIAEEFGIGKFLFFYFFFLNNLLEFFSNEGKPEPDMYLELTRRLNIDENHCIIFEDSISGVRAAVAAQIKCIGILTSAKTETLEQYGTWRTVKNFEDIDLNEIWSTLQTK
jgi:phosphoglycolate phosphatase-like HAD superfamily hydrolase